MKQYEWDTPANLFSTLFGVDESLGRFWKNIATK